MKLIMRLIREEKPLEFFSTVAGVLVVAGLAFAVPVVWNSGRTGLVPRLPTAVLSMGLVLLSFLSLMCGLVLATVTRGRMEAKRVQYLNIPHPRAAQQQPGRDGKAARKRGTARVIPSMERRWPVWLGAILVLAVLLRLGYSFGIARG